MKHFIAIIIVYLLLIGCSTRKDFPAIQQRDSTHIEVRKEVVYISDTVFVDIPAQVSDRTTQDSVSHLENDYAMSNARINSDGSLYHDLKIKPQKKPIPIEKPIEKKDSIIYVDRFVKEPVSVEKELTRWQEIKMNIGGYTIGVFFIVIAFSIVYIVRKFRI